jgi:hypothetical protein
MKHIGHTLFNDERYGGNVILRGTNSAFYKLFIKNCFFTCPRQALHAKTLGFVHPRSGEYMHFESELPTDLSEAVNMWREYAHTTYIQIKSLYSFILKMKKNIAIIAGGDSSEMVVSLNSAAGLFTFIDSEKYQLFVVLISKNGWVVRMGESEMIAIDKNDFSFMLKGEKTRFDFAYITIHGTPGENGLLQGYFDMIGMPYSSCGVLTSALTFSKYFCNQYLKGFGVSVANAVLIRKGQSISAEEIEQKTGFPCFVKA